MADEAVRFKWQWPAGRKPDYKLLIDVEEIRKESSGLFGIKKFESMADHLPDATQIIGTVIAGRNELVGKKVVLRAPRAELKNVAVGQPAGVAVINRDNDATNICICIEGASNKIDKNALRKWLRDMKCE